MLKRFCDACGVELVDANTQPSDNLGRLQCSKTLPEGRQTMEIGIVTGWNGAWNEGDFCKYCVIDAIKELDDRPTERN